MSTNTNPYTLAVLHYNGNNNDENFIKNFESLGKENCENFDLAHFSFNTDKEGKKKDKICKVCIKKTVSDFFKSEKGKKLLEKENLNLVNYKYTKLKYFNKKKSLKADNFTVLKNIFSELEGKFLRKGSYEIEEDSIKLKNNETGKFPYSFIKLLKALLDNSPYETEEGTKYLKVEFC